MRVKWVNVQSWRNRALGRLVGRLRSSQVWDLILSVAAMSRPSATSPPTSLLPRRGLWCSAESGGLSSREECMHLEAGQFGAGRPESWLCHSVTLSPWTVPSPSGAHFLTWAMRPIIATSRGHSWGEGRINAESHRVSVAGTQQTFLPHPGRQEPLSH